MQDLREPHNDIHREARLLLRETRSASLAVIEDDYPALALVTQAVTLEGAIVLLLSQLSAHTRTLDRDGRCALMVTGAPTDTNPQTSPRLSLVCDAQRSENPADRARYLAIHPYAGFYADFADFGLYRLTVIAARYVGGFARAATLDAERLAPATPALRDHAANQSVVATANARHTDQLDAIAAHHGGAGNGWQVAGLDADGCDLARDDRVLRVAFARPLRIYHDFITDLPHLAG